MRQAANKQVGFLYLAIFLIHFAVAAALLGANQALFDISGSTAAFSAFLGMQLAVQFAVSLVSGSIVDRFGPSAVLTACCVFFGALTAALAFTPVDSATLPLGILLTALALYGPFIHQPLFSWLGRAFAAQELQKAYGHFTMLSQGSQILGAALAVPLVNRFGFKSLLVGDAGAFLVTAAIFGLTARAVSAEKKAEPTAATVSPTVSWSEFAAQLGRPQLLLAIVNAALPMTLCALFNVALPELAKASGHGSSMSSAIDAAFCVGATLAGALVARGFFKRHEPRRALPLVLALGGLMEVALLVTYPVSVSAIVLMSAALVLGICAALQSVSASLAIQGLTGPGVKGRTSAVQQCLNMMLVLLMTRWLALGDSVRPFHLALVLTALSFVIVFNEVKYAKQQA